MSTKRTIIEVPLRPIIGSRFQPTGFPDLGAAVFDRPGPEGVERMLLLESPQSMANRLEGTSWDDASQEPVQMFADLPYVRVVHDDDDRFLTSSRNEAHRLASAFVRQSTLDDVDMVEVIVERLGVADDTPIDHRQVANAVFELDPFCLVHGVFFSDSEIAGQPKISRAVTGIIEAGGVDEAISGGVKRDHVRHSLGEKEGGTAEGYGSVPFSRIEYTAEYITASFVIDLAQLDSYGLPDERRRLLEAIAHWEIRSLLDGGLRLRTACDLVPVDENAEIPGLHDLDDLEAEIPELVSRCIATMPSSGPLEVRWAGGKKKKAKKST